MSPDLWDDLGHLFLRAADLPPAERPAFLDAACAGAPALRRRVETLLAVEAEAEAFFDAPSGIGVLLATVDLDEVTAVPPSEDLPTGARLGPWEVEAEVGRGGVGAVYRAHRADGLYPQTVALKVVKRGMDTDALLARFARERAVLAGLEHAGIARLVDGGSAPDGRPYLAMEFVDGEPITAYADRRRLGLEDRIGLFLQVCEAVAYAHRRLVVHRDLKPSNVLVAETASGPSVKLLDFGLAAVLAGDDGARAPLTRDGARLLTPEYAAPEQFDGGLVTTATDVYALGVVLYELLAGRRPFDVAGRPLAEIERVVREEDPPRPSTLVLSDATAGPAPPTDAAGDRATTPAKLRRRLRGDLDTVALKALRKEPDRRYPSVEALADDLRRHLAGLPVSARPDRAAYRARTFVRRHRWGVSTAALVALLLAGFGGQAVRQQRATAAAHDRAEVASAFVLDLLAEADPREGAGGATPVRDVLGRAARRAEGELGGQPALLARVLLTVGRTLAELGEYDRAERPLRRALSLAQQTGGPDGPDAVEARVELAEWARAQSRYDEAEAEARRAVAAAARLGRGEESALLRARALRGLAAIDADRGRFAEAVEGYRAAAATLRRAFPGGHRQTGLTLAQLGGVLSDLDSLGASTAALREAAAIQRRLLGPAHPELAATWMSLGNTFELRDSLDAAAAAHRQALGALRGAYGDLHGLTAMALHNLASAEDARGRTAEAARLYRQSLATKRRLYGDVHGSVAATLINLGYLQFETGDAAGAEATTREALRVSRAVYGDDHYRTAIAAYNLGEILLARRRDLDEAERLVAEALASDRRTYGPDDEGTLLTQLLLGRVQAARGVCGRARPTLREALAALGDRLAQAGEREAAEVALAACEG